MVAHSIPKNAKKVRVVVAVIADKVDVPLALKGKKLSQWIKNKPTIPTKKIGTTFKIVVMSCSLPEVNTPNVLIHVSIHIVAKPVNTANKELVAKAGIKVPKALIKETVIAALVHHTEIK